MIKTDIKKLSALLDVDDDTAAAAAVDIESEIAWVSEHTDDDAGDKPVIPANTDNIPNANAAYAYLGGKLNKNIQKAVDKGLRNDASMLDLTIAVSQIISGAKSKARTIARTAKMGQIRSDYLRSKLKAGFRYYRWDGPNDSLKRHYCSEHLGKIYSIAEILKLSNGQGLSVLVYMGGYNCRDRWVAVSDADYEEYRKAA